MKYVQDLPFRSRLDDGELDCGLWEAVENICEFSIDDAAGTCDPSGLYYGTSDEREPMFCARHFYQCIVSGDGTTNYRLVDPA